MICPKCKSRATGKIGSNQYYCWNCSIEFAPAEDGMRTYKLEPDGTAILEELGSVAQTQAQADETLKDPSMPEV